MSSKRLFNGRIQDNPDLKHITVDLYDSLLFITTYNNHNYPKELLAQFSNMQTTNIIWRKRSKSNTQWSFLKGEEISEYLCHEDGLSYLLHIGTSQNLGLFLDMAHARSYVRNNCQDKKVLNLFSYTCSFSMAAIAGGAKYVTNVDMKSSFLNWGRENHMRSKQDLRNVSFLKHNILKSLNSYIKRGPFDLIIIDPPTYQPGGFKLRQDYPKLLKKVPQLLSKDGEAIICSNDPLQSTEEFKELIQSHLPKEKLLIQPLGFTRNFDGPKMIHYHS